MARPTRRSRRVPTAILALVVPLLGLTLTASLLVREALHEQAQQAAEDEARRAVQAVSRRVAAHVDVLHGQRGLFLASDQVTRDDFRHYVDSLAVTGPRSGVQLMAFAERVSGEGLALLARAVEADAASAESPYPSFTPRPPGARDEHLVVDYVEPVPGNEAAYGFDLLTNPAHRHAAERARDTGRPSATSPIPLLGAGRPRGFAILLPMYEKDARPTTVADRRRTFRGVAYAAFRPDLLLDDVAARARSGGARFEAYDLGPDDEPARRPSPENLLYDMDDRPNVAGGGREPPSSIEVAGRRWGLYHAGGDAVLSPIDRAVPWGLGVAGVVVSLLIAWLVRSLATSRARAQTLAASMTDDLRASHEELARSNAELERFAYVASHDLQEPLRSVSGFLGLLERRYADALDERAREYIGFAVDGATRMSQLITGLLAYSRLGRTAVTTEPIDLGRAWDTAVQNLAAAIEDAGATVRRGELPVVLAEPSQVVQVLQNLVANAVTYRGDEPPVVTARSEAHEDGWVVVVEDNGMGIDPTYHDRIFIMFQRLHTRDEIPGTGLGLAISKKIVETLGGRMWVESEEGRGAAFHFTLPAVPEERTSGGPPPADEEAGGHGAGPEMEEVSSRW